MPTAPKKVRVRNEDPKKVTERQLKYFQTFEEIRLKPLKKTTKERYLKAKDKHKMTHDEFINLMLDKLEDED